MEEEQKSGALQIVTPVAALIIGTIIGFMVGVGQGNSEVAKLQAKIDAAKKFFPSIPEMRAVSGVIKSISGDTIIIESTSAANPFEALPAERTITITPGTKFVSFEQKDQAVFQKEMADFSKNTGATLSSGTPAMPPVPPMPFTEKNISGSDLKVGMMINVEADENIKEKDSFVAVKVTATFAMPTIPQAQ